VRRGPMGFWYRFAVLLIKPALLVFTRRNWSGQENIPRTGPVIIAVNHISYADPFMVAHYVYDARRLPRFLAKIELFRTGLVGRVVRGAGQIPVYRYTADASAALAAAVEALERGECVVIYPEGTVTKDPRYWPMRAKTGIARLVTATSAPVVPVGQWGAQEVYGRDKKLRLLPRKTISLRAGRELDLSRYRDQEPTAERLRECTDEIMTAVRGLVGELRGEIPPADVFDPRVASAPPSARKSA
jgi:1-acyl-sn-glycerol-3-phosphate acyltransferase